MASSSSPKERKKEKKSDSVGSLGLSQTITVRKALFLALVFMLPLMTGLTIALNRIPQFADAVASFFVTDPVKPLNIDRGYSADDTSQVNVFDDEAVNGYIIKARLDPAIDANFTVRIWSADSAICTATNPCQLSTNDMIIYGNGTDSATQGTGDIIDFDVRINASMAISVGVNDIDIIYTKERAATMQAFNTAMCNAMPIFYPAASPPAGSEIDLIDIRDGKTYKIRKLPSNALGTTGWCWMVDNLNLLPTQANPMILDSSNSDIGIADGSGTGTFTLVAADVFDPNTATYCNNLSTTTYPHKCGMQYNWIIVTTGGTIASGSAPDSICPKNWRLPVQGEYTTLSTALVWGNSGANVNSLTGFRGLYAGTSGITQQGNYGAYWSATTFGANYAYNLNYSATDVRPDNGAQTGTPPFFTAIKTGTKTLRCLAR